MAGKGIGACQANVENPGELAGRYVGHRAAEAQTHIVYQNIDAALQRRETTIDFIGFADIENRRFGAMVHARKFRHPSVEVFRIATVQDDVRAGLGHRPGDLPAETAPRPGDKGGAPGQPETSMMCCPRHRGLRVACDCRGRKVRR